MNRAQSHANSGDETVMLPSSLALLRSCKDEPSSGILPWR